MTKTNEYVEEAYQTLLNLSADERKRLEYEAREKAIRDYNSQVKSYRDQGIKLGFEQGMKQGIEQGIIHGKLKTYMEFIQDGLISIEEAAKRLEIPMEELERKLKEAENK